VDRIYAGRASNVTVEPGTCAEIATGAPLPPGADAVVMVEETTTDGSHVEMHAPSAPGRSIGRRGADIAMGDLVVRPRDVLTPSRVGALAAIGRAEVLAYAKPRVAILSTGNEVVEPGRALEAGQVYDVNRFTLAACVAAHGGVPLAHHAARDSVDALVDALEACGQVELIVFSGGSSVGERDLLTDLVAKRGHMIFHGIAVKPGKPTAFALVRTSGAPNAPRETPFLGMPGNPTSCLSNAYILLVPFLREIARLPPHVPRSVRVPIGQRIMSTAGRHQFYTVRLRDNAAYPAFKGSGDITSLSQADGYIEIPADQGVVEEGEVVEVILF
jgi:molybdenum cofactor synthesis domain-containing protein